MNKIKNKKNDKQFKQIKQVKKVEQPKQNNKVKQSKKITLGKKKQSGIISLNKVLPAVGSRLKKGRRHQIKLDTLRKGKKYSLYGHFIGILLKDGKKTNAAKIFEKSIIIAASVLKKRISYVLLKMVGYLFFPIEIRKINIKRRTTITPFLVNRKRLHFISLRNIILQAKSNKVHANLIYKLSQEIITICLQKDEDVLHYSEITKRQLRVLERIKETFSFIHFRW